MLKKFAAIILVLMLSGCSAPLTEREKGALVLGLWGAVMGAHGEAEGAAIGAVVGALLGAVLADIDLCSHRRACCGSSACSCPPQAAVAEIPSCKGKQPCHELPPGSCSTPAATGAGERNTECFPLLSSQT